MGEKVSWNSKPERIPHGHGAIMWEDGWKYIGEFSRGHSFFSLHQSIYVRDQSSITLKQIE